MNDQVLPAEISIHSDTWINRYRNYPIFSAAWYRHRNIAMLGSLFLMVLFIGLVTFVFEERWTNILQFMIILMVSGGLLATLGQGIAVWICTKKFSPRKEGILVSIAIVLSIAISCASFYGMNSAFKHFFDTETTEVKVGVEKKNSTEKPVAAASASKPSEVSKENAEDEKMKRRGKLFKLYANEMWFKIIVAILTFLPTAFLVAYTGSAFDLWFFFRQRRRLKDLQKAQEFRRAQEARREAELKLSILAAQVEPHFLFNTLAGVRSAIITEPLRATAIVDHLVDYLRSTIPQMRGDGGSNQARLKNQLDAARAYLSLMQARIPRLSFQIDSEVDDAAIPPLMLISLIENAVKHGIEPKIGTVHIHVHVSQIEEEGEAKLLIAVIDNGVGFGGSTSGSGIGLSNIRERLEAMFGQRARLSLKANPDGGVNASIVFPMQTETC